MAASRTTAHECGPGRLVILVGRWPAVSAGGETPRLGDLVIQRCPPEARALREMVAVHRPTWLLLGEGLDEAAARTLVQAGLSTGSRPHLAVLGPPEDVRRCERWVRRGCLAYLSSSSDAGRAVAMLRAALDLHVLIVDRVFQEAARARQVQPAGTLTRREEEVLHLVRLGLRNSDIAGALHLTENTVEFHVTRLLAKLGARNRVEAVDRATSLGLT